MERLPFSDTQTLTYIILVRIMYQLVIHIPEKISNYNLYCLTRRVFSDST